MSKNEEQRRNSGICREKRDFYCRKSMQQKTRFLLPDEKEVAIWPLEEFPKADVVKIRILVSTH